MRDHLPYTDSLRIKHTITYSITFEGPRPKSFHKGLGRSMLRAQQPFAASPSCLCRIRNNLAFRRVQPLGEHVRHLLQSLVLRLWK